MGISEVDRRSVLFGSSAGILAASSSRANANLNPKGLTPAPSIEGKLLVNRPRAYDVLDRYGLEGMIALDPINVYYLTNIVTIGVKFNNQFPGYATYAKDPEQPIYLVSGASSAWDIANRNRETAILMPYGYRSPAEPINDARSVNIEPKAGSSRRYHFRTDVPLTKREELWFAAQQKVVDNLAADASWGIARALKAQGITRGRVAVDDMRIAALLQQTDLTDIECVPGYGIFQLIRMVKTEQELAYQRVGGWSNGDACIETVKAIKAGMTHEEIVQMFRYECAIRGNDITSFIVGMPGGGLPDGVMVEGKPFLVDAVSHYKHYHGDTARTFIIGEPSREVELRRRANQVAREAVFDAIKPGVTYSTLQKIGFETMVKQGIPDYAVFVTPHSVGLQHDDNPRALPEFGLDRIDHILEENMVMTIDLPYLEVGYGTGHNEDLFRVTKTGYELFNTETEPFIIL